MKSYHINLGAGIAGLTLKENREPRPRRPEVLVRLRAVCLNYRELMPQFANMSGARAIALTSSDEKAGILRGMPSSMLSAARCAR